MCNSLLCLYYCKINLSVVTELQHYWKDSLTDGATDVATDVGRLLKSVDDDGNTPLHLACKYGFIDVAKTLIKMPGANIGARYIAKHACTHQRIKTAYTVW